MNKRIASTVIASTVGASLVFGLTACGADKPPAEFAKACKHVGGKTMREHDFEHKYLGLAPMSFEIAPAKPKGGKSKSKSKSSKSKKNNTKVSKLKHLTIGSGSKTTKPKKTKKHDDNEWVCVKNGVELFDQ
jgi:hypothetical protein